MTTPTSEIINAVGLKKGAWSHEEDEMLISYVTRYGIWNWSQMPRFAGLSRSGKSCRLRWMNYLKPNVKKGNFSEEENQIILHSHSVLGNRWSEIASKHPGRTDNSIKNHWHVHLKKRVTDDHHNNNLCTPNTSEQDDEDDVVEMIQLQPTAEHFNENADDFNFLSSNIISTTPSEDQEIVIGGGFQNDYYYDMGSPGTVDE